MAEPNDNPGLPYRSIFDASARPWLQPAFSVAGSASAGPLRSPSVCIGGRGGLKPVAANATRQRLYRTALAEWEGEGGRISPS